MRCSDSLRTPLRLLHTAAQSIATEDARYELRIEPPGSQEAALMALGRRNADMVVGLACSLSSHDPAGYTRQQICELPVAIAMSSMHPLALRDSLSIEDLKELTFLPTPGSIDGRSATWVEFRALCKERGFEPHASPLH